MTWTDGLSRVRMSDGRLLVGASFRGVPFYVAEAERQGGRRLVVHEFPYRDEPFVDDLGRRARVFRISGYVLGENYLADKDRLLAALEDISTPGELIHPYYGKKRCACGGLGVRERIDNGRIAEFDIEFIEAPETVTPTEDRDLAGLVAIASTSAGNATDLEFQSAYSVIGQPSFAVRSLASEISQRAAMVRSALGPITATTHELALLDVETKILIAQASSLVRTPSAILSGFTSIFSQLTDTAASAPRKMFSAMLDAYDLAPIPFAIGTTATRERERANQAALADALRRIFLIQAALLMPDIAYETLEDALADRARLLALLDEQAASAGDETYPALMQLRAAIVEAVPGDRALARVLTVSRSIAIPSLLLAYQLYGSVEQELDIVARNSVQHPGFLPASLQVLSSDE